MDLDNGLVWIFIVVGIYFVPTVTIGVISIESRVKKNHKSNLANMNRIEEKLDRLIQLLEKEEN